MSKHTITAVIRGGTLSAALVAGVLFAPNAIAGESAGSETEDEFSVVEVGDVGSGNSVNVCHNNINALGVQVADIANGLGANLPILNDEPVSSAEGSADCEATAITSDGHDDNGHNGDDDNGHDDNGNGHDDNGNGHDDNGNGNGHNGNGHDDNGGGAGSGNGDADEHADADGTAPQPIPAPDHISVTG